MLTQTDFGTNYTYEISRRHNCNSDRSNSDSNCDRNNSTTIIREEISTDDINVSLREPTVPDSLRADETTQIDKFQGVFSNILTDPDNSPRYIFTNVWICSETLEGKTHTQMHSVPASMIENLRQV